MKLASFDIFDTTLIRKCGRPENIFYILSNQLFPGDEALRNDFFMWRLQAEYTEKERSGRNNLNLKEIYKNFNPVAFNNLKRESVIEAELALESSQLVSNKKIREIISEKRRDGYAICFISDMYIDSSFLKSILLRENCAEIEDLVYISCEYDKTKASGELYDEVKKTFEKCSEWIHYGDNIISDIKQSKKKGIIPVAVDSSFTKNEQLVEMQYMHYPFGYQLSILVGFQRCARLNLSMNDDKYENAADYTAAAYIPYLFYIFRNAKKNGIKRLYFLYRDSHILYKLSDLFNSIYPDIDCRALYASRKSLFLATLEAISLESICHVVGGKKTLIGKQAKEILDLFHIDTDKSSIPFDMIDTLEKQDKVIKFIKEHEDVITDEQKRCKELLVGYLSQEGLFDNVNKGIVDVGWYGSTRMMINSILREMGHDSIPFFYYCNRKDVLGSEYGKFYSFLPHTFLNKGAKTLLFESYFSICDTPSTIGYYLSDGVYRPLFDKNYISSTEIELTNINIQTCRSILSCMIALIDLINFKDSLLQISVAFIDLFNRYPQHIKLEPFTKIVTYNEDNFMIKRLSLKDFMRYLIKGSLPYICLSKHSFYYTFKFDGQALRNKLKQLVRTML